VTGLNQLMGSQIGMSRVTILYIRMYRICYQYFSHVNIAVHGLLSSSMGFKLILCLYRSSKCTVVDPVIDDRKSLSEGQILRGYIVHCTKSQLLVRYVMRVWMRQWGSKSMYCCRPIIDESFYF